MATLPKSRHRQQLGANPNENAGNFCFTCENGEIRLQEANIEKNRGTIELKCFSPRRE